MAFLLAAAALVFPAAAAQVTLSIGGVLNKVSEKYVCCA